MEIKTMWAKSLSYSRSRPTSAIKYIVLHFTGNRTDTARGNGNYFRNGNTRKAGAHYFVDEKEIIQSVGDHKAANSVGIKFSGEGGGTMWGKVTNYNSISIEMCSHNGVIQPKTIENAVWLVKKLMKDFDIPASNVYRHWDVCGKPCPGWSGWYGASDTKWKSFKAQLTQSDEWNAVTTDKVNVREKASKDSKIIGKMEKGERIHVVKETNNWVQRKHGGWVAKKYLRKV